MREIPNNRESREVSGAGVTGRSPGSATGGATGLGSFPVQSTRYPTEFCYWLQGAIEIGGLETVSNEQAALIREPQEESYGTVAVFKDLYGNLWDSLQPRN